MCKILNMKINNIKPAQSNEVHNYNTRANTIFLVYTFRTNLCRSNAYYNGFNIFNNLPSDLRYQQKLSNYKTLIVNYLTVLYFRNIF